MTTPEPKKGRRLTWLWVALAFFVGLVAHGRHRVPVDQYPDPQERRGRVPAQDRRDRGKRARPGRVGPELPARVRLVQEDRDRRRRDPVRRFQLVRQAGEVPDPQARLGGLCVQRGLQRGARPLLRADRSEGNQAPGCGEAAGRLRQLPRRARRRSSSSRDGLGERSTDALQGDLQARCTRAPPAPTATTRPRWSCASPGPHSRMRWRRAASI